MSYIDLEVFFLLDWFFIIELIMLFYVLIIIILKMLWGWELVIWWGVYIVGYVVCVVIDNSNFLIFVKVGYNWC